MSPDELAQIKKLEGDLLEECTKRVEAEANVRNLERINRALGEVVERQWQPISNFKHTNGCWMFCDEHGNRWIDTGPDMFHVNGCGFPATHFRELPAPPGSRHMKMPDFPEPFDPAKQTLAQYLGNTVELEYERSRAEAWEARARLAVQALKVAQQAAMEASHAQEVGPDWYTRGRAGMEAQVVMWNNKAAVAVRNALDAIGELPPA